MTHPMARVQEHDRNCPGCFGWDNVWSLVTAARGNTMASKSFNNEDTSVVLAVRVTLQVRAGKTKVEVRVGEQLLFPETVVLSKEVRRTEGHVSVDSASLALEKVAEMLSDLVTQATDGPAEVW